MNGGWLSITARAEPEGLCPGGEGTVKVDVAIPADSHIQAHDTKEPFLVPAELTMEPAEGLSFEKVRYPPAEEAAFAWSPSPLRLFHGTIRLEVPVIAAPDARPGPRTITGRFKYQGCTPVACLRPGSVEFEVSVRILD